MDDPAVEVLIARMKTGRTDVRNAPVLPGRTTAWLVTDPVIAFNVDDAGETGPVPVVDVCTARGPYLIA